ncbi:MAG: hypothetical protein QME96_08375, partial [Myxococcota bacterium]|nr:hypothetical protein [Myxococcota bacterium]
MGLAGRRSSRSSRRRRLLAAALLAASTCRPPDLTASGGCLPGFERLVARADRDATGDAPAEDLDAISVAAAGEVHAAGVEEVEPPPLRVRIAVRSGASRPGDSPVTRDDPFLSRLAAAMGTRPLFEADPDVEALAERLARLSARPAAPESEAGGRTTGLEPFLVATVSLEPPAPGAAVREPTYVVGLTLATERTTAGTGPPSPPAVRWELELPVRAVRSDRLVTTVAQAIEARASVEIDRTVSAARSTLAAVASGTAEPGADETLFRAGPAAWGDLLAAVRDGT